MLYIFFCQGKRSIRGCQGLYTSWPKVKVPNTRLVESLQKYQWCRSFSVVNECWFGKIPKNKHLDKRKKKQQAYRGFHQVSSKLFQGLCEAFIGINFIGIHFCLSFTIQPDFHMPCHECLDLRNPSVLALSQLESSTEKSWSKDLRLKMKPFA